MITKNESLAAEFSQWVKQSVPGQKIEYFLGRLDHTRHEQKSKKMMGEDIRNANQARAAARRGLVDLVQRRIREGLYSYLAIRRGEIAHRKNNLLSWGEK